MKLAVIEAKSDEKDVSDHHHLCVLLSRLTLGKLFLETTKGFEEKFLFFNFNRHLFGILLDYLYIWLRRI